MPVATVNITPRIMQPPRPCGAGASSVSALLQSAARAACLRLQGRLLAAFALRTHAAHDASWACVSELVAAQWLQVGAGGVRICHRSTVCKPDGALRVSVM